VATPGAPQAQLEHLDGLGLAARGASEPLRALLAPRLADWRGLMAQHPERARETVLRLLLTGRLVMRPARTDAGCFYEFSGAVSYGGLLAGLIPAGAGVNDGRAPGVTRTPGTQFRKLLLYPPELRGRQRLRNTPDEF